MVSAGSTIGWVAEEASSLRASSRPPAARRRMRQSGCRLSSDFCSIQSAKLSLSQRSSHQAMVTRSPNHWWAISWPM